MPDPRPLSAVLFNATVRGGHHGCTVVCRRIDELAAEAGISVDLQLGLDLSEAPGDLARYDLILVNGEGSLHHDGGPARKIAAISREAARLGRPAYLVNSVYEANGPEIAAATALFRRRSVRDAGSAAEMAAAGLDAAVVPDLSLTWSPPPAAVAAGPVVVTDSIVPATTAALWRLARRRGARFVTLKTWPPVLPRHPGANARQIARHRWRRPLEYLLPPGPARAVAMAKILAFDDFVRVLAAAPLLVTGRFHAMTLAMDLEVPFLAVGSNTRKVEGLLADAGLSRRVYPSVEAIERALAAGTPADFAFSEAERSGLRAFRAGALQAARALFRDIADDARAHPAETARSA
jgi:hypothetical protein